MSSTMATDGRKDFDVVGPVVLLVAVDVMHDLAGLEQAAQFLASHEPVLVHIAAAVGERVAVHLHQPVAATRKRPAALPVGVF